MRYHPWQTMKVGDEGEDVKHLQQLLSGANRIGYDADPGPVTGVGLEGVVEEQLAVAAGVLGVRIGERRQATRDLLARDGQFERA